MNIVGKILVILNLLFALAVGGFLVVDFATRQNWKEYAAALKKELDVARTNSGAAGDTMKKLNEEIKKARADAERVKQDREEQVQGLKAEVAVLELKVQEEKDRAKDADLNHQKAVGEVRRLEEEVKGLSTVVKKRDDYIIKMEQDVRQYRAEAVANENMAKAAVARSESLLAQITELRRKIAETEAGVVTASNTTNPRAPSLLNPPQTFVKGVIEKVDVKDPSLVQISLGTDQGVNKGNTLEAYRLSPRPEYLGTILVTDANHHKAVGRLMRNGAGTVGRPTLREGDQVASKIGGP